VACFYGCARLQVIIFESNSKLSHLEEQSFAYCDSLRSIVLPASVEVFGRKCFEGCCRLVTVTFGSGSKLAQVEAGAFSRCPSLTFLRNDFFPFSPPWIDPRISAGSRLWKRICRVVGKPRGNGEGGIIPPVFKSGL
jgi:hypothetical protein